MLTKIHIENFKSLKNIDVPCCGLNLLTGVNGAGKSSFIQVLRLLHLSAEKINELDQEINVKDFGAGTGLNDVRYSYGSISSKILISASYIDGVHEFEIVRTLEEFMGIGRRPGTVRFAHPSYFSTRNRVYDRAENLQIDYFEGTEGVTEASVQEAFKEADKVFDKEVKRIHDEEHDKIVVIKTTWEGARFIDAFRRKPTDISEGGRYDVASFMFVFPGCDYIKTFNPEGQDVMEFLYKYNRYSKKSQVIEKVNQCLNWVSPGARLSIDEKQVGERYYYVSAVDYGVDDDTRMFKPQNVGFGVSYILPVLATLLTAEKGNILIIENPEAHLHPRGQAEIGKLIAETVSRGVQVFIETHSDHVINGIRVAVKKSVLKPSDVNIAFFERKEHDVVDDEGKETREIFTTVRDIKVDENGSLSEYPEDFMDEWNNQLMRLM